MREVTISLSDDTYAIIEQRAKAEGFEGVESFLNDLLRNMVEVRREGKLFFIHQDATQINEIYNQS